MTTNFICRGNHLRKCFCNAVTTERSSDHHNNFLFRSRFVGERVPFRKDLAFGLTEHESEDKWHVANEQGKELEIHGGRWGFRIKVGSRVF